MRTLILAGALALAAPLAAVTHNVSSGNFFYSPNAVNINAGDTVQWSGLGSGHNVAQSADAAATSYNGSGFRSGGTNNGISTFSHQFNTPGTYYYVCENHAGANMKGQVVVAAAATATPSPTPTATPTATAAPCVSGSSSADLHVNFGSLPASVASGQALTVIVVMSTGGGPGSYNTTVDLLALPGGGASASLMSTPVGIPNLSVGTTNHYTWTYSLSGNGTVSFSATGSGSSAAICPCTIRQSTDCSGAISVAPPTATFTLSPTPSATVTATPSWTPTATLSPTVTVTPTTTQTLTLSPTFSISQTLTYTMTPPPTLTPQPLSQAQAATGVIVNSPKRGEDLCVVFDRPVFSAALLLYNFTGQRVAVIGEALRNPCVKTHDIAPGLYVAKVVVGFQDGSTQELYRKAVIQP